MPDSTTPLPPEYYNFLDAFRKRYAQAEALSAAKKHAEAIKGYHGCLDLAIQRRTAIGVDLFVDVWLRISASHIELNHPEEALRIYQNMEQVLTLWTRAFNSGQIIEHWMRDPDNKKAADWKNLTPDGLTFLLPKSFDPRPALAAVYEALGPAYDLTHRVSEAAAAYQQAIDWNAQLGNPQRVAQAWKMRAVGCQRRQDWAGAQQAAEHMLAGYKTLGDLNGLLDAYTLLFLTYLNQNQLLPALEHLRQAINLERESGHPLLTRDEKTLADLRGNLRRQAVGGKSAAKPVLAALPAPEQWPTLVEQVTVQVVTEKNNPAQLMFVLRTPRLEELAQWLRVFPLTVTVTGLAQWRVLPELPIAGYTIPAEGALQLEFRLDGLAGDARLATLVLPQKQITQLQQANLAGRGFSIALEGTTPAGPNPNEKNPGWVWNRKGWQWLGKSRAEVFRIEPYVLDWEGWEGIAILLRTHWPDDPEALDSGLDSLLTRLKRGRAVGLPREVGQIYDLRKDWQQAAYWYQQEIRLHLTPTGGAGRAAARACHHLGKVHQAQDQLDQARLCYETALVLNPNDYEALVGLAGLTADSTLALRCLTRAYRLQPDETQLNTWVTQSWGAHPLAAEEAAQVIRQTAAEVDLGAPLAVAPNNDPIPLLKTLVDQFLTEAPPLPERPALPAPVEPAAPGEPEPTLASLEEVMEALQRFAQAHCGAQAPAGVIEEMMEYRKDTRGQLTTTNIQGAVLPLSLAPELVIRVTLAPQECVIRLLQEFHLPNTDETALKSVYSEHLPPRREALEQALAGLLTRGVLTRQGGQLRYHGKQ